ncbi:MAG: transcription antitermination factor NusB, partial [bacterium]|nr:transcription antitermination factor NusB [bacterium]
YELLKDQDIPPKVAINEAVEIAKTFGGENSSKFINGVLGTLYRQSDRFVEEEPKEEPKND